MSAPPIARSAGLFFDIRCRAEARPRGPHDLPTKIRPSASVEARRQVPALWVSAADWPASAWAACSRRSARVCDFHRPRGWRCRGASSLDATAVAASPEATQHGASAIRARTEAYRSCAREARWCSNPGERRLRIEEVRSEGDSEKRVAVTCRDRSKSVRAVRVFQASQSPRTLKCQRPRV